MNSLSAVMTDLATPTIRILLRTKRPILKLVGTLAPSNGVILIQNFLNLS
jgi:hypothetical protein